MAAGPPVETLLPCRSGSPAARDVRFSGGDTVDSPLTVSSGRAPKGVRRIEGGDRVYEAAFASETSDNRYGGAVSSGRGPAMGRRFICGAGERDLLLRGPDRQPLGGLGALADPQQVTRAAVPPAPRSSAASSSIRTTTTTTASRRTLPGNVSLHVDAAQQCTTSYDPSRWSMAELLCRTVAGDCTTPIGPACLTFYAGRGRTHERAGDAGKWCTRHVREAGHRFG